MSDRFKGGTGRVHCYNAIDRSPISSLAVPYSSGTLDVEEMEGIALGHLIHGTGLHSKVHVLILDNDLNPDDVYVKHYLVPQPGNL